MTAWEDRRGADADAAELRAMIDEEVTRLPERYRSALVLCDLEGQTHEQAAAQLRCPVGTVKSRLAGPRQAAITAHPPWHRSVGGNPGVGAGTRASIGHDRRVADINSQHRDPITHQPRPCGRGGPGCHRHAGSRNREEHEHGSH